jgi:hypothetical protein
MKKSEDALDEKLINDRIEQLIVPSVGEENQENAQRSQNGDFDQAQHGADCADQQVDPRVTRLDRVHQLATDCVADQSEAVVNGKEPAKDKARTRQNI